MGEKRLASIWRQVERVPFYCTERFCSASGFESTVRLDATSHAQQTTLLSTVYCAFKSVFQLLRQIFVQDEKQYFFLSFLRRTIVFIFYVRWIFLLLTFTSLSVCWAGEACVHLERVQACTEPSWGMRGSGDWGGWRRARMDDLFVAQELKGETWWLSWSCL